MSEAASSSKRTLYLIDGHAQIFRAYHAIRSLSSPVTQEPTNATFGFVGMLLKLFRECDPDYVAVAIDVSGDKGTFRSQIDPEYKATRDEAPNDLHPQVQRIIEICQLWGIPVLGLEGFEADDVIATLCDRLAGDEPTGAAEGAEDVNIRIVSRDKDLQQLLNDRVEMYDVHKDEHVDVERLKQDLSVTPGQVVDMLALMGDKVDNIPGVPGVGPKTAAKLIAQFGSLEQLMQRTDELTGKLKDNVEAARDRLLLNRELVTLRRDVPIDFGLEGAHVGPPPVEELEGIFKQLGFTRHLRDLQRLAGAEPSNGPPSAHPASAATSAPTARGKARAADAAPGLFDQMEPAATPDDAQAPAADVTRAEAGDYHSVTSVQELENLIARLRKHVDAGGAISIDTETDRLDAMQARLCGIAISHKAGSGCYVPVHSCSPADHLESEAVLARLRPLLEDPAVRKVGQNLKYDMLVLRRAGVELAGVGESGFDTIVASYLIDATRSSHKLDTLALAHLKHEMIPITDLIGTGRSQKSMADLPAADVAVYAAEDADVAMRLRDVFEPQLEEMGLTELFATLEMPLVEVLAELEYNGIRVEPAELDRQKKSVDLRIAEIREQIIDAAGVEFNPDSPKQLAQVLFKDLGCRPLRRGKTGPSTDSGVLQRIADDQPPPGSTVAALVLDYRQHTKLRNTYLEALKDAIHPETGRIHASFNQTVTQTGRLSSSDPNLQNIPIRTELGKQIRRAFVAEPGHVLLAADYSQIELRMLAHLSEDEGLIEAFDKDLDIHTAVAAEVFGVELDAVTSEQRASAKMVNFGIVYGITPYGLARRLPPTAAGSKVEVAKQIIADYKARYPRINGFLQQCVDDAHEHGYVETIRGRRRAIPQITSNQPNVARLGERMAINTVVQGSAADLIKLAMVRLHRRIRDQQRAMKMLVQIHDELIFEVPEDAAEAEAAIVREEMRTAMDLRVPLKVDLSWGESWYDTK